MNRGNWHVTLYPCGIEIRSNTNLESAMRYIKWLKKGFPNQEFKVSNK